MPDIYVYIRFAHVLGAIAVGYYLLLPFLVSRMKRDTAAIQSGTLKSIFTFNRIAQWILILQFITGGYMFSEKEYAIWWIAAVIIVFLIVGAMAGMMAGPMKRLRSALERGESGPNHISRIQVFSTIVAIGVIVLVVLMAFPSFR